MPLCRYLEPGQPESTWQHANAAEAVEMMRRILADDREQGIKSKAWVDGKRVKLS